MTLLMPKMKSQSALRTRQSRQQPQPLHLPLGLSHCCLKMVSAKEELLSWQGLKES